MIYILLLHILTQIYKKINKKSIKNCKNTLKKEKFTYEIGLLGDYVILGFVFGHVVCRDDFELVFEVEGCVV